MRCLAFVNATVPLTIVAEHIKGEENVVVDALSRDRLNAARSAMQVTAERTKVIPKGLVELLTAESRSWSEQEWRRRSFCSIKA